MTTGEAAPVPDSLPVDGTFLAAVVNRIVPADEHPSATAAGALAYLASRADNDHADLWRTVLADELARIEDDTRGRFGLAFADLVTGQQDAVLADVLTPESALVRVVQEAYYAPLNAPSWQMVGYDAGGKRPLAAPVIHVRLAETPFAMLRDRYDVVIVGAGAGGGTAAGVLAEAGLSVLLTDRGDWLPYDAITRDHVRNHRLALYGHNTGPEAAGNPRVYVDAAGVEHLVAEPHLSRWHNNAMTVGGGSRVYQGIAWRFLPEDFELATRYGTPSGSSLADWPISYADLEPYYSRAEWEVGVCGAATHARQGPRSRPYPMPPFPSNAEADVLQRGADDLGWSTGPVPLLINSIPRAGRAQCVRCGECVGFPCPTEAKNGSFTTLIPRALDSANAQLATRCRATRVTVDARGRVDGVELVDIASGGSRRVTAGHVVLAGGAIESARLLLLSASTHHPDGIGNRTDQVGRHLQGHVYAGAFGLFDEVVIDGHGPGVRIATCDFNHGMPGIVGGGHLHNEVVKLPFLHWLWALPPDAPRWGLDGKRAMREMYGRTSHVQGPIQEIPMPGSRVVLDPQVRDAAGLPVARLTGPQHPESVCAAHALRERAVEWLEASGAERTWRQPITAELTAGQHQAGTCRMGADPASSVTDPWGRVHGHENLWVMDGSVLVTNGGFNPVLTIYALAFRAAEHLAQHA